MPVGAAGPGQMWQALGVLSSSVLVDSTGPSVSGASVFRRLSHSTSQHMFFSILHSAVFWDLFLHPHQ